MDRPTGVNYSFKPGLPPQPPRLPGIWSGLGMVALYFVLQMVVGVVLVFAYGLIRGLFAHGATTESIMHSLQAPDIKVGLVVVTLVVTAVCMLWLVRRFWPAMWRVADPPGFGYVRPNNLHFLWIAVAVGVVAVVFGGWLTQFLANGHEISQNVTVMSMEVTPGMRIVLALMVVCVAPVVEETLFRGVLLSGLIRYVGVGWGVAISAVIFGAVHLPDFKFAWYPVPALALLGALLAWVRLHSRSLWPSIIMHATNNLVAVIGWFVVMHAPH
ncbi:MAG TPA: CPBP family intramembrane glutamic endopeptidase [Oleiagrimonas sp.]|nr:CPBP family intramembrane glutamic endopeptidase [Oleiagrimonas sp.]